LGISILDAIPCGVVRAGEPNARPNLGQDDQGRHFYSLVGQDIPVLSDKTIGWLLGPGDGSYRLDPEFREQLDTPMQGLLTTLKPLAEALRSVQAAIISTVSEKGKQRLDRVAPQFHLLAELGGAFRKHIIRAFAARFRGFAHHDTPVTVAGQSLRAYAAAHAAAFSAAALAGLQSASVSALVLASIWLANQSLTAPTKGGPRP
jgi:hypothetical protein